MPNKKEFKLTFTKPRDSSHDDKGALKALKREVSNLQTPRHEDHAAKFKAMTTRNDKENDPGNG